MNVYFPMDTLLPLPWSQYASSGGKPYYFNSETQETRFEPPPGAVQLTGRPQAPLPSPARSFPAPPLVVSHDVVKLTTSAGAAVAEGYTLENFGQDTESRQRSVLFHLRQLNNWVKSTLIQEFSKRPCNDVMDMACGKFGDLRKWVKVGVKRIAGLDISRKQLSDAVGRLMEYNHPSDGRPPPAVPIGVKMVLVDASFLNLGPTGVFGPSERFDVISVQFALHYMFETEASALTFFRNIGDRLMPGGVFMGTIADGNILIRNLRNLPNAEDCEFGNSLYRVRFYPESKARQWRMGQYPFGIKYNFHLKEAVLAAGGGGDEDEDGGAEGLDEFIVPPTLLDSITSQLGWRKLCCENFHEFFTRMASSSNHAALKRLLDWRGSFSDDEWEVAGLYRVFAYERPSDLTTAVPAPPHLASAYTSTPTVHGYKTSLSPDDIIDLMSAPAVVAATVAAPAVTAHSAEAGEEDVPMYGGDDE